MAQDTAQIRARAIMEVMLALGVKEITVQPKHVYALGAHELHMASEPEGRSMTYTLLQPITIEGEFSVRG
jgi:hypothetical protein